MLVKLMSIACPGECIPLFEFLELWGVHILICISEKIKYEGTPNCGKWFRGQQKGAVV